MKTYKMKINGEEYEARVRKYDGLTATVNVNGVDYMVELETEALPAAPKLIRSEKAAPSLALRPTGPTAGGDVPAPIPGIIVDVKVKVGDVVRGGDVLCILEAMKMESEITAPFEGTVKEVRCQKGASVVEGDVLVVLEPVGHAAQPVVHKAAPAPAPAAPAPKAVAPVGSRNVVAPIPGLILDVKVQPGDVIKADQVVVILEAMKMESEITAPAAGKVKSVRVKKGDSVQEHDLLVEVEA